MNLFQDTQDTNVVIKAGAAQTAKPLDFQLSDGTSVASVSDDGTSTYVTIGKETKALTVIAPRDSSLLGVLAQDNTTESLVPLMIAASELSLNGLGTAAAPSSSPTYVKLTINGVAGVIPFYPL